MGVRLNTLTDPALRLGLEPPEIGPGGVVIPPPSRAALPGAEVSPRLGATGPGEGAVAGPAGNPAAGPQTPLGANRADEETLAGEPRGGPAVNPEAGGAEEANDAPPPRFRDFRFLLAAESLRESELETRLKRLERELETVNNRLKLNDSFMVRTDARLERARLERDLDLVESQIGRLRLERVFSRPAAASAATEPAATVPSGQEPSALPGAPGLNLLA